MDVRKQHALELIMQGTSFSDTARACQIDERTLRRWRAAPEFEAALNT